MEALMKCEGTGRCHTGSKKSMLNAVHRPLFSLRRILTSGKVFQGMRNPSLGTWVNKFLKSGSQFRAAALLADRVKGRMAPDPRIFMEIGERSSADYELYVTGAGDRCYLPHSHSPHSPGLLTLLLAPTD
jgi:hypothetical protein